MNLLSGLEKFGLKADATTNLFEEEKKVVVAEDGTKKEAVPDESSFLLDKAIRCTVCDKVFKTKMVNSRVKRLEPDLDLRPRYEYIDTLKYNTKSCPYCGYTAVSRYFEHLSSMQIKLVKEQICANFKASDDIEPKLLSYDEAIERYKLALFCSIAKKAKTSEKAYTCLNIAWLFRGKYESLDPNDPALEQERKECKEQEEAFYAQAFEGLNKAMSTENYPICGMDECTMDYLLATMAYHFKKFDVASKCIARIQQSAAASKKMKDRAYDLKEKIVNEIKKSKQQ
ncbi:MAG: DUF2225 domain-containing protein [Clostridiales bacterium]|nr:DUF2225 domain-containing protein [Roseburia sp.]MDD7636755.1 DUF2225 domain-containing protein [Clostridiales bacterium]MDY4113779.1 DUF2225 domain-containing protein [Roseburia sp.]